MKPHEELDLIVTSLHELVPWDVVYHLEQEYWS